MDHQLLSAFFWIFSGAAALATAALFTRQPMIVAYLALGALLGPYGFGWVTDGAKAGDRYQTIVAIVLHQ